MSEKGDGCSITYATLPEDHMVIGGKKVSAAELGVNMVKAFAPGNAAASRHRRTRVVSNARSRAYYH